MQELINQFNKIQSVSSLNSKKQLLEEYKNDELFKRTLKFLLDTYIVTGISSKKINKNLIVDQRNNQTPLTFSQLLEYLKINNTGRDIDISVCQSTICSYSDPLIQEFIKAIITKSYKLGIDTKTVNKVYGKDFIPTWEIQLGSSYDKLKLKKNEYFFISQKLNGNRASYINGKLISRQGKEFTGLEHILQNINLLDLQDYFIDGELIRKNIDNISDNENFRIGTGIINSDDIDKSCIKLVIFDIFPAAELDNKESSEKYSKRKQNLLYLKQQITEHQLQNVEIVEMLYEGTDTSKIDEFLNYAVANDWEGLMLNKDTTYKCKRTIELIKVKRFYTMDLRVVGFEKGTGRLENTLGALIVKYKDNLVHVGSGYDDETRNKIWQNKMDMIGKIIEVKYKEISKDKNTGLESLQFPVFVQIRNDRSDESYN